MKCSRGKARRDEQVNPRLTQNWHPAKDSPMEPLMHERRTHPQAEALRPLDSMVARLHETARTGLVQDRALPRVLSVAPSSHLSPHIELDLLDAQAECRRLVRAGTEMHEEILVLHHQLAATGQQVQALLADQQEYVQTRIKLQFLEARVDALLQSASWRITKPLRLLYRQLTGRA